MHVQTFLPSASGRTIRWRVWRQQGGCGLSHQAGAAVSAQLGPESTWGTRSLGEIADSCVLAGREVARFAREHLHKPDWTVEEVR